MNNFNYQDLSSSASSINNPTESSSFSDTSVTAGRSPNSDTELTEVVLLSSSKPKKRAGRRVFKETRHPVYSGVRHRNNNKWVCEVREPNKKSRIWLGTYPTAEMAARAHDVAALALRGKQACLNFADSTWRLPVPASSDQLDIRRAAAEAAEGFRPEEFGGVSSSCDDDESSSREQVNENVPIIEEIEATNYGMYEDEESMFDMPRLLNSMAEGLLLSPPCYYMDTAINWAADDDVEIYSGFSLWS